MKKRNLILCSLLLSTTFIGCAKAEESVVVNLHVLDGLSSSSSVGGYVAQQPLFPIVKKSPIIKRKKTTKKAQIKAKLPSIAPKANVEIKKAETTEKVTETVAPVETTAHTEAKPTQQIPFVESTEPVVVVDVEPVSSENINKDTPSEEMPKQDLEPVVSEKTEAPELLIDETKTNTPKAPLTSLVFAPDSDEITEDLQKQIDQIIASFADATNNKIAIYSYNLEDGVDSFKKKRISLNRAVAVRSYLLPKGYKNFSIKVINIDGASNKGNTVELEELKN